MKLQFNLVSKIIISTMALSSALLCSFAANAVAMNHDGLKLKEAAPADTKTKAIAPEPQAVKPAKAPSIAADGQYTYTPGATAPQASGTKTPPGSPNYTAADLKGTQKQSATQGSPASKTVPGQTNGPSVNAATGEFTYTPVKTSASQASGTKSQPSKGTGGNGGDGGRGGLLVPIPPK